MLSEVSMCAWQSRKVGLKLRGMADAFTLMNIIVKENGKPGTAAHSEKALAAAGSTTSAGHVHPSHMNR
jgi:hypothetical protein